VRESVSEVLAALDGAPAAAVVPVPASDCLTKTPVDVSPEPMPAVAAPAEERPAEEKKPRKRAARVRTKAEKAAKPAEEKTAEKKSGAGEQPPPPALELSPDQILRLGKLAPKSVGKLKNTLATQFHVADVVATVRALQAKGTFSLDGSRVLWPAAAER